MKAADPRLLAKEDIAAIEAVWGRLATPEGVRPLFAHIEAQAEELERLRGENQQMRGSISVCSGPCVTPEQRRVADAKWEAEERERQGQQD